MPKVTIAAVTARIKKADALRARIKSAEAQTKLLKDELHTIESEILDSMVASDMRQMAASDGGQYALATSDVPSVTDWPKLDKYILKTGKLHLLNRRLTTSAYREEIEAGAKIPGVVIETITKLSYKGPK